MVYQEGEISLQKSLKADGKNEPKRTEKNQHLMQYTNRQDNLFWYPVIWNSVV